MVTPVRFGGGFGALERRAGASTTGTTKEEYVRPVNGRRPPAAWTNFLPITVIRVTFRAGVS